MMKAVEVLLLVKPVDPDELASVEDLTDDAGERLVAAVKAAGFEVLDWDTREPAWLQLER